MHKPTEGSSNQKALASISKLAHCWTGPYKVLVVSPGKTENGREVGPKLLLLEIRQDEPGRGINARISVHRCRKCFQSPRWSDRTEIFAVGHEHPYARQIPGIFLTVQFGGGRCERRARHPPSHTPKCDKAQIDERARWQNRGPSSHVLGRARTTHIGTWRGVKATW